MTRDDIILLARNTILDEDGDPGAFIMQIADELLPEEIESGNLGRWSEKSP